MKNQYFGDKRRWPWRLKLTQRIELVRSNNGHE
jgi:hypothetical protein